MGACGKDLGITVGCPPTELKEHIPLNEKSYVYLLVNVTFPNYDREEHLLLMVM